MSLFDFENKEALFPIHRSQKFCLLTLSGVAAPTSEVAFACYLTNPDQINDQDKPLP